MGLLRPYHARISRITFGWCTSVILFIGFIVMEAQAGLDQAEQVQESRGKSATVTGLSTDFICEVLGVSIR
jgi:hypothetical protein